MNLIDLPEEILLIIIKKLDLKSVYNLYKTCVYLKHIVCMKNVIKTCVLAVSTMATVQSFKLKFILDISRYLQNLDVRGVSDITKTSLLIAVKRMKCLETLDVSYTNITIIDLIEVYKLCPTIKNIACNFVFGKNNEKRISQTHLIKCQNMFQNFDNIHFIGNAGNLLHSNTALWILHKAKVNQLKLTVVESQSALYEVNDNNQDDDLILNIKFVSIYLLNEWRLNNLGHGSFLNIPSALTTQNLYEYIAMISRECCTYTIYASTMFKSFFMEHFKIEVKFVKNIEFLNYVANAAVMLWNRSETVFDNTFFTKLKNKLLHFFPNRITDDSTAVSIDQSKNQFDRVFFPVMFKDNIQDNIRPGEWQLKRKRLAPISHVLNYDNVFCEMNKIQLTLFFQDSFKQSVDLSPNSQYLRKLTYLSLSGNVHYSFNFFNILFRCCEQLETLNVEASSLSPCSSSIARNIPISQRLKNFRLIDRKIDFKILFSSLSQCNILENIHILDISMIKNYLSSPSTLLENCNNLYCLYILATMSISSKVTNTKLFKQLKDTHSRHYLHLQLCSNYIESRYNYDPYIDVFNLISLKPL